MHKKKVLILCAHYLPGFRGGGPITSISNLVQSLGDYFDFTIFTSDRDLNSETPYPFDTIGGTQKATICNSVINYIPPDLQNYKTLNLILQENLDSTLYLNSFFNWRFSVLPVILRASSKYRSRLVIAPRGEFSPGALAIKPLKKKVFITLARIIGLYHGAIWHATCEDEAQDIHRVMKPPKAAISVASNLTSPPVAMLGPPSPTRKENRINAFFLSRISPKKNLHFALSMLRESKTPISFTIYGTEEDAKYYLTCRDLIKGMPRHVKVFFGGEVRPEQVRGVVQNHELLFLPTAGENFGHVIYEALSSGVPVLISDQTPWRGLFPRGAGWDLNLKKPGEFQEAIRTFGSLTLEARDRMRMSALTLATEFYTGSKAAKNMRHILSGIHY